MAEITKRPEEKAIIKRPEAKGKGNNNERFDSFLGLLILLVIIGIVIRYFNKIMIAVAIFAAVAITGELINFFKAEDIENEEQDPVKSTYTNLSNEEKD